MNRFCGIVGFAIQERSERNRGIIEERMHERTYYGDVIEPKTRWTGTQDGTNDNITLSSKISIVADPFAYQHCSNIRFVEYMGACWKVTDVSIQSPRLLLTVGGVWNGERA